MVKLEPVQHRYFNEDKSIEYTSVSRILSEFYEEFNSDYWSDYKAIKDVLDKEGMWYGYKKAAGGWEEVVPFYKDSGHLLKDSLKTKIKERKQHYLDLWKKENKIAIAKGHKFHDNMEKDTISINQVKTKGKVVKTIDSHNKLDIFDTIHHDVSGIFTEVIVYNNEYKIAGTMDRLEKFGIDVYIHDYKTNKEISQEGFRQKTMLHPLEELQDCNYNHYLLQLNTYAWMLEEKGYKVRGMVLEHVTTGTDYNIPYRPDLVKKMLNAFRQRHTKL